MMFGGLGRLWQRLEVGRSHVRPSAPPRRRSRFRLTLSPKRRCRRKTG